MNFKDTVSFWYIKAQPLLIVLFVFLSLDVSARLSSSFRAQGLGFVSEDFANSESSSFSLVGVHLKSVDSEKDLFKANVSGAYAFGSPFLSYLNMREFFVNTPVISNTTAPSQLIIGRRIVDWSIVDRDWSLSAFQPNFRWNPLQPTSQGLTGLFWQTKAEGWGFTVFASPLFIPDQSAGYELKDGEFKRSSPWFSPPPQSARFGEESLAIQYSINTPPIADILYQTSFGAQIEFGERDGFFGQLAGMYKPSNQIALTYEASVNPDPAVEVEVVPKSFYENTVAGDFGWRSSSSEFVISALNVRPQPIEVDPNFTKPEFSTSNILALRAQHEQRLGSIDFEISAAHLQTSGGESRDVGPDAISGARSLSQRIGYDDAFRLGTKVQFRLLKAFRWTSDLSWTQTYRGDFRLAKLQNRFQSRGPWSASADLYFVDAQTETSPMYSYRDLDQVWMGLTYDF